MQIVSNSYDVADIDEFTELAYTRGWTDGIPVLPPTEHKVVEMLEYYGRDPGHVVGVVSPGEGLATIEKIAINAVMAGCKPEYLPVVVAAIEAIVDPVFEHMRVQCTTGGPAPLTIISGPVVKKLDFNYSEGVFGGSGHRANSTVARAVRLILWNIGLGRPGELSHATQGHPARYAYLVAERPPSDGNPWEELHVTNGFNSDDSVVSMFPAGTHDQISTGIGAQTLENNIEVIADSFKVLGHFQAATQKLFVINPQGVKVFNDAGWDKARFRDAILARSHRPLRDIKMTGGQSTTATYHWTRIVKDENDLDESVPAMMGPNHLQIMVAGGWGPPNSQCVVIHSMHGEMVSKKIDWSWD